MADRSIQVLFVCLGNICRSPLAEGVLRQLVAEAGLGDRIRVVSAGTGDWHVGKPPDARMVATAAARDVDLSMQRAQVLTPALIEASGEILVMDRENLRNARALISDPALRERIRRFREDDPEPGDGDVPDPYYGGEEGFVEVFGIVDRTARALLNRLRREHGI
ncbi:MAG TPA: low molecular weight protein-tyrosine-phosphatase [Myxococcaceae bacterium]|nr:low molecular weight protein-tyrosine-phosphatase [Myxococcaceae bacterium]